MSALLLLISLSWAQPAPSLLDRAQSESQVPISDLAARNAAAQKSKKKNAKADVAPAATTPPSLVLKLEDQYEAPRLRNFQLEISAALETFRLTGAAPENSLGDYDVGSAGSLPLASVRLGFLKAFQSRWHWGASLYGGYGARDYNLVTKTDQTLRPRINVITYGVGATARYDLSDRYFADVGFDRGSFSIRQSSRETSLAQWSDDSTSESLRLMGGWNVSDAWQISGGLTTRRLIGSRLDLDSSNWILSSGVRW